ncbi:MAG: hypothetical protein ACT4O0_18965, partial [Pseudonocardia sp.]
MLTALLRRRRLTTAVALTAAAAALAGCSATGGSTAPTAGGADPAARPPAAEVNTTGIQYAPTLVVYNGRSHYGDEKVFEDFEAATGVRIELRGGTGPELFERLRREGTDTPADVLITTDLANLWRAEEAGLLQGVTSQTLRAQVPERLHDPGGQWWSVSTRVRVPVVATER